MVTIFFHIISIYTSLQLNYINKCYKGLYEYLKKKCNKDLVQGPVAYVHSGLKETICSESPTTDKNFSTQRPLLNFNKNQNTAIRSM